MLTISILALAALAGTAAALPTDTTVTVQPAETVAGEPIAGPPTVLVTDDTGAPVQSAEVVVSVAEGPGHFDSGLVIKYTDANGEIAFDSLVLDEPGTYRLEFEASSSSATPVMTDAFDVVVDPTSVQAQVDAADPGDTVAITPGTYEEDVLVRTPNLVIEAAGGERPTIDGGFEVRADNVTLRELNVTTGIQHSQGRSGVLVARSHELTVERLGIHDVDGIGVDVDGNGYETITITDVDVRASAGRGVWVTSVGQLTVSGATVRDTGGPGVAIGWEGSAGTIDEASIAATEIHNATTGIDVMSTENLTITDVAVEATSDDGVNVTATNVTVDGADVRHAGGNGITVDGADTVSIENATLYDATGSGVFVTAADEATITGTDVDTAGADGILVGKSGDVTVEGSTIRNADRDGLGSYSSTNVTAIDTTIRDVDNDGLSIRLVDTTTVSGGEVRNAVRNGVYAYRSGGVTVTDAVVVDSGTGVEIVDVGGATLTTSHIANNTVGLKARDPFQRRVVDATNNWWGASDGPGGEGPGHGNAVHGTGIDIEFEPFLTITNVDAFDVGPGFTGVVHDDGGVPVTASGFSTDAFDVESGVAFVEISGQTVPLDIVDGEVDATINASEHLDPTTETGVVAAEIEGQLEDDVRLVHEAHDLEAGYTRWSIPQPAALYTTDGVTDVTAWDNDASTYDDAGFATDDGSLVTDGAALHRGTFVYAETGDERLGYDFATPGQASLPPGGAEPIGEGWNLLGSNYDASSNDNVELNHDLATVTNLPATPGDYTGEDPVVAYDPRSYNRLGGTHAVGHYDTYWVYVDVGEPTEFRAIVAPEYDPAGGE